MGNSCKQQQSVAPTLPATVESRSNDPPLVPLPDTAAPVAKPTLIPPSVLRSDPEPDSEASNRSQPHTTSSPNPNSTLIQQDSVEVVDSPDILPQHGDRVLCVDQAIQKLKTDEPDIYKQLEEIKSRPENAGQIDAEALLNAGLHKTKTTEEISKQVEKTFRYILHFKDVVAAATTIDPHKVAPIVWRGFCLILETCLGDSALIREELIDLGKIMSYFAEWTNFELSYLGTRHTSPNRFQELEPELVTLHKDILKLGVKLFAWSSEGRIVQVIKTPEKSATWKELVKIITAHHESCNSALKLCKAKIDEAAQVQKWIFETRPEQAHEDALERTGVAWKYRTCGQWLLDDERFKKWSSVTKKVSDCRILWLCGTVGTGKSTLLCRIIQWHLYQSSLLPGTRFAYFYCSRGTDMKSKHSRESVLRAILRQAAYDPVTGKIFQDVQDVFIHAGGSSFSFSKYCERLLHSIVRSNSPRIKLRIMIDALDECDHPRRLLSVLRNVVQAMPAGVELLVSSRNDVEVGKVFDDASLAKVELLDGVSQTDMDAYIISEVNNREKHERLLEGEFPELEERLIEILCGRANGMFRWVQLQLSFFLERNISLWKETVVTYLYDLDTGEQVVAGMEDLNIAYKAIFKRNTEDDPIALSYATKIYRMLLCSKEPLSIAMITEGVSVHKDDGPNVDEARFRRLTADFTVADSKSGRLEFAHVSVKDYLQSESDYSDPKCHAETALICIKHISSQDPTIYQRSLRKPPFTSYASSYWGLHCSWSTEEDRRSIGVSTQLKEWMLRESGSTTFQTWLRIAYHHSIICMGARPSYLFFEDFSPFGPSSQLAIACLYNLVELLRESFPAHQTQNTNPVGEDSKCDSLLLPSRSGITSRIGLVNVADEYGYTPLHWAAFSGHLEVVKLLLEEGADATAATRERASTPLHFASRLGDVRVVELLLTGNASINTADKYGHTPLLMASSRQFEVVKLLLDNGADVNAAANGNTPLHHAVSRGNIRIANLLLENNANVNAAGRDGCTPLRLAAQLGYIEVVTLLLGNNANVNAVDEDGYTALHVASDCGGIDIVKLLLEKNADVKAVNNHGLTPLHSASMKGNMDIVELLLEKNADLNAVDKNGQTPLSLASEEGRNNVVALLLKKNADTNTILEAANTPLPIASIDGCIKAVKHSLERKANAKAGDRDTISLLLQSRARHDRVKGSPLESRYINIVEQLEKEAARLRTL